MFFVYALLPNRVLRIERYKEGDRMIFANKEWADSHAAYRSTINPYPYTVDTSGELDNTRDGKKI